jgi:Ca2+-binding EF-hand superfamily protein
LALGTSSSKAPPPLSPQQIKRLEQIFCLFDIDGNQSIDMEELHALLEAVGVLPQDQDRIAADLIANSARCVCTFPLALTRVESNSHQC